MNFAHDFPNREEYKFKGGISKYDGKLNKLDMQITDRYFNIIQDFFWIEWLLYDFSLSDKFIYLSELWAELDAEGIKDISASNINKLDDEFCERFFNCIEKKGYQNRMQGFGFLFFDSECIRKKYFIEDYEDCKIEINRNIDEIYYNNEAIIMCWACFYNALNDEKLHMKINFDIQKYVKCLYSKQEMAIYNLQIQSTCKVMYDAKIHVNEFYQNNDLRRRLMSEECKFFNQKINATDKDELRAYLNLFSQKQYLPLDIENNDYKYLVNIGFIKMLYDLSLDLLEITNISSRNIILRTIIETTIMLCYINKKESENKDIFKLYVEYGQGKVSNLGIKFEDEIDRSKLRMLIPKDIAPHKIDISHKYFEGNIKGKFDELGQIELYDKYYEFTNLFTHCMWPAISLNAYNVCQNSLHTHYILGEEKVDIIDAFSITLQCWKMINNQKIQYICEC